MFMHITSDNIISNEIHMMRDCTVKPTNVNTSYCEPYFLLEMVSLKSMVFYSSRENTSIKTTKIIKYLLLRNVEEFTLLER